MILLDMEYLDLIDAIDKFDYGKNVKFETYASLRIRGAILRSDKKDGLDTKNSQTEAEERLMSCYGKQVEM